MVFQSQLLLFQTAQRHGIGPAGGFKNINSLVQITMLTAEHFEADPKHVFKAHFAGGIHGGWKSVFAFGQ